MYGYGGGHGYGGLSIVRQTRLVDHGVPQARTWVCHTAAELQAALNGSQLGDTIILIAGQTYQGDFTLPVKNSGVGWVTIQSSSIALLPAGVRVSPSSAAHMPTIQASSGDEGIAMIALPQSHHYRFLGLHFRYAPLEGLRGHGILYLGNNRDVGTYGNTQTTLASVPSYFIVDRCFFEGHPTTGQRRGLELHSAYTWILNSYFKDFKNTGNTDSQAIGGNNGPGPYVIDNCYLEASAECIMFGGRPIQINGLIPSDISVTRCLLSKPLRWRTDDPNWEGTEWSIKNLFELKNAQRVVVRGCVMENSWAGGQNGFAVLINAVDQSADEQSNPWVKVEDVLFEHCVFKHVGGVFNFNAINTLYRNIRVRNCLAFDHAVISTTGIYTALFAQIQGGPDGSSGGVTIEHCTSDGPTDKRISVSFSPDSVAPFGGSEQLIVRDNAIRFQLDGFLKGDGVSHGTPTLNMYYPSPRYTVQQNVVAGDIDYSAGYPAGAIAGWETDANFTAMFQDAGARNYRLDPGSPYKLAATDGIDIGCDIDALDAALVDAY